MITKWNKRTNTKNSFKSKDEFEYFVSHSSVFGRWDFEDYKGQKRKEKK